MPRGSGEDNGVVSDYHPVPRDRSTTLWTDFLNGTGWAVAVAAAVLVTLFTVIALFVYESRSQDARCDELQGRTVTNQEQADALFDEKAKAGCL